MTEHEANSLYYLCSMIEYISRKTNNYPSDVIKKIGKIELRRQFEIAEVNHCLSFEQVSCEIIEEFEIPIGTRNMNYKYELPRYLGIGREYQRLIEDVKMSEQNIIDCLYEVFTSFISEAISDYNSSFYYGGRTYIAECYRQKKILD